MESHYLIIILFAVSIVAVFVDPIRYQLLRLVVFVVDAIWVDEPEPTRQIDPAFWHERNRAVQLRTHLVGQLALIQGLAYVDASNHFNALNDIHWRILFDGIVERESSDVLKIEGSKGHGIAPGFDVLVSPIEDLKDYDLNWNRYVSHMRYYALHRNWPISRDLESVQA